GIGAALRQKEAHSVLADPIDEVAHSDVAAGSLGNLDFGTVAHHLDHFVQDVGGEFFGNTQVERLQPGAYTGDGAVVVGALDVDGVMVAAFPFGDVVGHVGHKVGVAAFALAHDAVFVVAGAQLGG